MKGNTKIPLLAAGALLALAVVLYSCGGGYGGGGSYGGMGAVAPGMFSLSSPADGANPVGITPALTWTASANATDYLVQVEAATGNFTGTLLINKKVGATIYTYTVLTTDGLVTGTAYHWRIVAENIYGQAIAGPRTFTP